MDCLKSDDELESVESTLIIKAASDESLFNMNNNESIILHDSFDLDETIVPTTNMTRPVTRSMTRPLNNTRQNASAMNVGHHDQKSGGNPLPGFADYVVRQVNDAITKNTEIGMSKYYKPNSIVRVTKGPSRIDSPYPKPSNQKLTVDD